jgi:hypothetical protein
MDDGDDEDEDEADVTIAEVAGDLGDRADDDVNDGMASADFPREHGIPLDQGKRLLSPSTEREAAFETQPFDGTEVAGQQGGFLAPVVAEPMDEDLAYTHPETAVYAEVAPSVAELAGHQSEHVEALTAIPVELDPTTGHTRSGENGVLPEYGEFMGQLASPINVSRQQLIDGLLDIVSIEGPVMGHRLHTAYVKASGGQRVGKSVAKILNSAISTAVQQGKLLVDDPLQESGVKPRTYRLPGQPEVRPRTLGPRTLDHVPPRELAELVHRASLDHGWENDETLFRAVLAQLDLHRLTSNVEQVLGKALDISRRATEQDTDE